MSTTLTGEDLKKLNPICSSLGNFIQLLQDCQNVRGIPPRLMSLSQNQSIKVHIFKDLNMDLLSVNRIVLDSRDVLEATFQVSEKEVIHNLFLSLGVKSEVSMISLTCRHEESTYVIATSLYSMCDFGCYIAYVSVIEKDLFSITENGYFCNCGLASFMVCVIQLVTYNNFKCCNMYCWSNNSKKKKDLWKKLGFTAVEEFPKEIEFFSALYHLPTAHALKSGLIAKAIRTAITSFDAALEEENNSNILCDDHILTIEYYKDKWWEFDAIECDLDSNDERLYCLLLLKQKIDFSDLPDNRSDCISWLREKLDSRELSENILDYSMKISYIFQSRLQMMVDTLSLTGDVEDLKNISYLEGLMSEVALDYCLMSMFFGVKDIFPISSYVFTWWNSRLDFNVMKEHFQINFKYSDHDIIEDLANNREMKFIIPYFEESHYTIIVRRWIQGRLTFFYSDSSDDTMKQVKSKESQRVPYAVFAFLMNSPLWPYDSIAYWVRVPSVSQQEDECGFRSVLHGYLLATSKHPLTSLLPLNYFGTNLLKSKSQSLYKYRDASLPTLCRSWIKDIMYSKQWKVPDWINDVLNHNSKPPSTASHISNYLKLKCNESNEKQFKEIVMGERQRDINLAQQEKDKQLHLLSKKSQGILSTGVTQNTPSTLEVLHSDTMRDNSEDTLDVQTIVMGESQHDINLAQQEKDPLSKKSQGILTAGAFQNTPFTLEVLHSDTMRDNSEDTLDVQTPALEGDIGNSSTNKMYSTSGSCNSEDILDLQNSYLFVRDTGNSGKNKMYVIGDSCHEEKDNVTDYGSDQENEESSYNYSSTSSVFDNGFGPPPWRLTAADVCEDFDCSSSSESDSSINIPSEVPMEVSPQTEVQLPLCNFTNVEGQQTTSFECLICNRPVASAYKCVICSYYTHYCCGYKLHDESFYCSNCYDSCISDGGSSESNNNSAVGLELQMTSASAIQNFTIVPVEMQPPLMCNKRPRKSTSGNSSPTQFIESDCIICNRPVNTKFECVECSHYIHYACGFKLQDGTYCCSNCYVKQTGSSATITLRRVRQESQKDTELSSLWNTKQIVRQTRGSQTKVGKEPVLTRDQRTMMFNQWLSQITYIKCKKSSKKGSFLFFGSHDEFQNVKELYSRFVVETLLENEAEILSQLQSDECLDKWCPLPDVIRLLIRARGECFSNHDKFSSFDMLEQHEWSFMKCCTMNKRQTKRHMSLIDAKDQFTTGTYYISLSDSNKQHFVTFVPKYFIYRWHRICEKYKAPNCGNEFMNLLCKAKESYNKWVRIDAGRYRSSSNASCSTINIDDSLKAPVLFRKQSPGESSCIFSSLVNAFHYINDYQTRDVLLSKLGTSLNFKELASESVNRESYASLILNRNAKYQSILIKNFNILGDRSIWPTLCILKGSDGSITHAVTVVDDYIFDSSTSRAMDLNRKNLDWCCSSDCQGATFDSVVKAYRFFKKCGPSNILIRNRDDIAKGIKAFIRLFMCLYEKSICLELECYEKNFRIEDDFFTTIIRKVSARPHSYTCSKLQKQSFQKFISGNILQPVVLLLYNDAESYRLITIYDGKFYDGSRNPGYLLYENMLKKVLRWENISLSDINIVRGYMFVRRDQKTYVRDRSSM